MKKLFLILLLAFSSHIYSQNEFVRWEKAAVSYTRTGKNHDERSSGKSETGILDIAAFTYRFFISDLDGDNCPFNPVCSAFFIRSAKTAGLFKGALMFADRFTRDINIVKTDHYPFTRNFHLYDPVENYMLQPQKIRFIPPAEFVNE